MKKRLLSGVKPTGDIHIGNYFGAMKQFVDLQDNYENFIFIADYHALNQIQDPQELSQNILEVAKAFLAIGLDPKKTVLFRQSDINPVTELAWIFNCITPIGILNRAHAYKDAVAKNKPVNMGLFDYPVLMAADILIYKSDVVPVGRDQQQHLEITQDIARKFNYIYGGEIFKIPEGIINEEVAEIKGLDGRKMSKSYKNTIGLFDSEENIKKKVMSIVTDSKRADEPKNPESCNIFSLHKLFSKEDLKTITDSYKKGKISYKESKELLIKNINKFLGPIRERKEKLDKDPQYIYEVLEKGKKIALGAAQKTLDEAREKVGLKSY